jgi:hypothetical protein
MVLFTPAWKSKNEEKALSAIPRLNSKDLDTASKAALYESVRNLADKYISIYNSYYNKWTIDINIQSELIRYSDIASCAKSEKGKIAVITNNSRGLSGYFTDLFRNERWSGHLRNDLPVPEEYTPVKRQNAEYAIIIHTSGIPKGMYSTGHRFEQAYQLVTEIALINRQTMSIKYYKKVYGDEPPTVKIAGNRTCDGGYPEYKKIVCHVLKAAHTVR